MFYLKPFTTLLLVFLLQDLIHRAESGKKKHRWNWKNEKLESVIDGSSGSSESSSSSDSKNDEKHGRPSSTTFHKASYFTSHHSFSHENPFSAMNDGLRPFKRPPNFPQRPPHFLNSKPPMGPFGRPPSPFINSPFTDDEHPFLKPFTGTIPAAYFGVATLGGSRPSTSESHSKPNKPSRKPVVVKPIQLTSSPTKPNSQNKPSPSTNSGYTGDQCDYCTRSVCHPTVKPYPNFDVGKDVSELYKAVDGLGTDEDKLVAILTKRSEVQLQKIVNEYGKTGRTLPHDIAGDTSFKFKAILLGLVTPLPIFNAEQIHKALDDKDTSTLIEILTSLSDCAIREMSVQFDFIYKKSLPVEIKSKSNMNFQKFLLALARGDRDPSQRVDKAKSEEDANSLISSGVKQWFGSNENTFIEIFSRRSFAHLREVLKAYDSKRAPDGGSIEKDIEKAFWGKLEEGLLKLVKQIKNQPLFFAEELNDALGGKLSPNNNDKLIRILRGRSGIDLRDIQREFDKKYDTPLADRISQGTYFDYRKSLLGILNVEM